MEKNEAQLSIEEFLLLSSENTHIEKSFAFTALQTNGRVNLRRVKDF